MGSGFPRASAEFVRPGVVASYGGWEPGSDPCA